jgi:hypothetical protein
VSNVFPVPHPRDPKEYVPESPGAELFARIEGLIGEERGLLAMPAEDRRPHHVERLREIGHELDRMWEKLRERAERRAPKPEVRS